MDSHTTQDHAQLSELTSQGSASAKCEPDISPSEVIGTSRATYVGTVFGINLLSYPLQSQKGLS